MNTLADAADLMRKQASYDRNQNRAFLHAVADLIEWHATHDVGGPSWRLAHAVARAYLGNGAS